MTDLIERVARAIADTQDPRCIHGFFNEVHGRHYILDGATTLWEKTGDDYHAIHDEMMRELDLIQSRAKATAAINVIYEDLKEPSDEMVDIAQEDMLQRQGWGGTVFASDIWEIMLSASPIALKGGEHPVENGGNSDG